MDKLSVGVSADGGDVPDRFYVAEVPDDLPVDVLRLCAAGLLFDADWSQVRSYTVYLNGKQIWQG